MANSIAIEFREKLTVRIAQDASSTALKSTRGRMLLKCSVYCAFNLGGGGLQRLSVADRKSTRPQASKVRSTDCRKSWVPSKPGSHREIPAKESSNGQPHLIGKGVAGN